MELVAFIVIIGWIVLARKFAKNDEGKSRSTGCPPDWIG